MNAVLSRRGFVVGSGALVVGFSAASRGLGDAALAQAAPAPLSVSLKKAPAVDSWIRIAASGEVTVFTGKVELGQGIRTALTQIAAEELDVAFERVTIVTADTERTPDESTTSRSHSIIESGNALRAAAAEARSILVAKAAERLAVPIEKLRVADGLISSESGREQVTYWALLDGKTLTGDITGKAPRKDPKSYKYLGKSMPRLDIPGKILGQPSYVQDLRPAGMLHGRIVRAPSDRADVELVSIDTSRAARMPGVVKIVRNGKFLAVIAEREEQAIAAAAALRKDVQWKLPALPPQADIAAHLRTLPAKDRVLRDDGQVDDSLAKAHQVVEQIYFSPFQSHGSIGPSCAVAQDVDGGLTVWTHSQGVFELRQDIADVLGRPVEKVHLIHVEGSGCYGQNGADDVALDAALLALEAPGRPVRVQWMRQDEFACAPKSPAMAIRVKAGLDAAGSIVAWDYEYWTGPHISRYGKSGTTVAIGGWHLEKPVAPFFVQAAGSDVDARGIAATTGGMFEFPNKRLVQHATVQFTPLRSGEFRGVAAFPHAFAIQSMFDELAVKAGADPVEFRLRFVKDQRMREVIEAVTLQAGWKPGASPSGLGRGFSYFFYDRPMARAAAVAEVEVDRTTGRVKVKRVVAGFDLGQIINPDGVRNQMEGGIIQAMSRTLKEAVTFEDGEITSVDWNSYPIVDFTEIPKIEIVLLDRPNEQSGGAGEAQTPLVPGAIANAIFDSVGARLREIPFTPARVKAAMPGR